MSADGSRQTATLALERRGGLSCEIHSNLRPSLSSHDWHVQPSCQRPEHLPLGDVHSGQNGIASTRGRKTHALDRIRLSSKPYKPNSSNNALSTRWSHRISTRFAHAGSTFPADSAGQLVLRASNCSSAGKPRSLRRAGQAEERKLEKRSLGGSAKNAKPFEEPCPRIKTPWREPISEVFQSLLDRCRTSDERFGKSPG